MVASAQMQPSSLCDLFLTLHTCLAARDQTGTGQKQQKPGQGKGFLFHSIQHSPGHVCSTLCLWAPQYKTHSDLLQQFHLMDKKRPRQPGWSALREGSKWGKPYWNLQIPLVPQVPATSRGSRAGLFKARNKCSCMGNSCAAEKFSPCVVRLERYRTTAG